MKAIRKCPDGGYKLLRHKLTESVHGPMYEPDCPACQWLLKDTKFNLDNMRKIVQDRLEGDAAAPEPLPDEAGEDGDGEEGEPAQKVDPLEYPKSLFPVIQILPAGSHGKTLPYRCTVCKTKGQPEGKIGEMSRLCKNVVDHFVKQHVKSSTHIKNLNKQKKRENATLVDCRGVKVNDPVYGKYLFELQKEFSIWATHTNLKLFAKHTYWHDANEDSWYIRAVDCPGKCENLGAGGHPLCDKCHLVSTGRGVAKTVHRFSEKYYFAQLAFRSAFSGPRKSSRSGRGDQRVGCLQAVP